MEENKKNNLEPIDLQMIVKKLWNNRQLFYKVLFVVFVLSCIYIVSIPRYYSSEVKLAPETENSGSGSTLGSIAANFGFDISEMQTSDAITPFLYPDLMEDNGFLAKIMTTEVTSKDGKIKSNYHDYLKFHQKKAWWSYPISWLKSLLTSKDDESSSRETDYDPYYLSKEEEGLLGMARGNIRIAIDKKTGVISIEAQAQDPLISKTLADSVKDILQLYITDYRTNKARTDYEYYKELTDSAKMEYEKVLRKYASISDASTNVSLRSVEISIEDIENDLQLKLNAYTTLNTQMLAAKAKVQERTPAFTVIKGASVPVMPAGPKRMIFVAGMLVLATILTSLYVYIKK